MNTQEIASLSGRVEIRGIEASIAKLGALDGALGTTARTMAMATGKMEAQAGSTGAAFAAMGATQAKTLRALRTATVVGGGAVVAATSAALAYGIKLNASWESNQAAFTTFLGSAKKATAFTEKLRSVSSKSPLRLTEYAEAAKMLLGYGMAAEKIVPTLSAVNKAVVTVGKGEPEMKRVVLALGQMQGAGKATAEELRQLAEVGVPVNKILQRELGLSGDAVKDIATSGISSGKVISAIVRGWNKDFGEGYKNAANTFNFQMAAAKKTFEQFLRVTTFPAFEALRTKVLPSVNEELAKLIAVIDNPKLDSGKKWALVGKWFEDTLAKMGDLAADAIPKIYGYFQKSLPVIERGIAKITPILNKLLSRAAIAVAVGSVQLGVAIAKGLVQGFAESDLLGKLFMGAAFFKLFGGYSFLVARGMGIGTVLMSGITKAMVAFNGARALTGSIGAGMSSAGGSLAASLIGSMSRAIPIAAAAFGLVSIISSVVQGDTEAAMGKVGGALAGGAIGLAVGGPLGAAIGAGIGVGLAGPIASLFGGGGGLEQTLKEQIASSSNRLAAAMKGEVSAMSAMKAATAGQIQARQAQKAAAERATNAEQALNRARNQHGPNSERARAAEARYRIALDDSRRAEHRLQNANRETGAARRASIRLMRSAVTEGKANIFLLKQERQQLIQARDANLKKGGSDEQLRRIVNKLTANQKQLDGASGKVNRTIQAAGDRIGPKFAKSLEGIKGKVAAISRSFPQLEGKTQKLSNVTVRGFKLSDQAIESTKKKYVTFDATVGRTKLKYSTNMSGTVRVTRTSMGDIRQSLLDSLDAIQNTGEPQAKRKGGLVNWARKKFAGRGVPVRLSPGEFYKTPDGRRGIVPGNPVAADSVSTAMPVGTKIFTFDGQARLMAGASESEALRRQAPHFAAGGIVHPQISGSTVLARKNSQSAVDRSYAFAKKKYKKLKAGTIAGGNIVAVGRSLQKMGYEVGENPAFGGVQPVHSDGSYHYSGRAIDVNDDINPKFGSEKASLDWLYARLSKMPHAELLWQVADHYDHLHFAMRNGGLVQKFGSGGRVREITDALLKRGYSAKAAAGIVGNAYREAGPDLNPGSVGTGGGGLFGFTSGAISLANLQRAAAAKGVDWKNIDFQVGFMDAHMPADLKARLNGSSSVYDATTLFMDEWERPGIPAFGDRLAGANMAWAALQERKKDKVHRAKKGLHHVERLWRKIKRQGSTKAGKKLARLAGKNARGAIRDARSYDFAGATSKMGKVRKLTKKAYRKIGKLGGRSFGSGGSHDGSNANNGNGPQNGSDSSGYTAKDPFSGKNYPGLPKSVQSMLAAPGLTWDQKASLLDGALTAAQRTDTPLDDAAIYGKQLGMNQSKLKRARASLKDANKAIKDLGGKAKLKILNAKIRNNDRKQSKLENALGKVPYGKKGKKARERIRGKLDKVKKAGKKLAGQKSALDAAFTKQDTAITNIADAQSGITSANTGLADLNTSTSEDTTTSDLVTAMKELTDALNEQNALAAKTQGIAGGEIGRAVKDWLSGELVGKGIGFGGNGNNNLRY